MVFDSINIGDVLYLETTTGYSCVGVVLFKGGDLCEILIHDGSIITNWDVKLWEYLDIYNITESKLALVGSLIRLLLLKSLGNRS